MATPVEIAENDYNLNIPRYVDTFEPEEEIDIAEVQREIDGIEAELWRFGRRRSYRIGLGRRKRDHEVPGWSAEVVGKADSRSGKRSASQRFWHYARFLRMTTSPSTQSAAGLSCMPLV